MPEAINDSDRVIAALTEKYTAGMNERQRKTVQFFATKFSSEANAIILGSAYGYRLAVTFGGSELSGDDVAVMVYAGMAMALDLMAIEHLDCGKDGGK